MQCLISISLGSTVESGIIVTTDATQLLLRYNNPESFLCDTIASRHNVRCLLCHSLGGAVARSMSCSSVSSEEDLSYLFGNSPTGCGSQMGVKAGMMGGETVAMLKHKQQELHQGMCCRGLSRLRELSRQAR